MLQDNLTLVRQRIQQACQRSGRDPSTVTLVCVTKDIPLGTIQQVIAGGVTDVGENRVQEAESKWPSLQRRGLRWHLIGHLQRNKVRSAIQVFDVIHSVDSLALIDALEHHATAQAKTIEALIQVNISGEPTKFGCTPQETHALAEAFGGCKRVTLSGLMTMAPFSEDPQAARPHFRRLRELRDEVATFLGPSSARLTLSMGMSHDFEVAIEEGADVVRIGTAIFKGAS